MNKDIKYFGIDISHLVFDVTDSDGNYYQFKNSEFGFKKFTKLLKSTRHCVMEATGYYEYQLAYHLLESGIKVSVENPLSVKRFIQMKLSKIKIDKSDSKLICAYGEQVALKLWQGNTKMEIEYLQIVRALSVYTKQSTMLKNKLHGESVLGNPSKYLVRSIKRSLRHLHKEMKSLEEKLLFLVNEVHQDLLTRLKTIPGIGPKTAIMLVVLTGGFERFTSAAELCSYAGLPPVIRQSGSSVKGKSKKLALIAVCNKLLKQAFAIAKSGLIYDGEYKSTLVKN
jgi:transposase